MPFLPIDKVDSNLISYGPCQTPTLWFCVNREREMKKDNPIFYKIYIKLLLIKSPKDLKVKICLDNEFSNKNDVKNILKSINKMKYVNLLC